MCETEYVYKSVITIRHPDGAISDILELSEGASYSTLGFLVSTLTPYLQHGDEVNIDIKISSTTVS